MAVAIASKSFIAPADASTITIAAPSSISTGDLLVMVVGAGLNSTLTLPAGWTTKASYSVVGAGALVDTFVKVAWKIAVLADETAINYITTTGTESALGGAIYRITGWTSGDPFFAIQNGTDVNMAPTSSYAETGLTDARPTTQVMIQFAFGASVSNGDAASSSNYSITSADSNPTWTEYVDTTHSIATSSTAREGWMAVADTTSTDTSTVTGLGFDWSVTDDAWSGIFGFLMITSPTTTSSTSTVVSAPISLIASSAANTNLGDSEVLAVSITPIASVGREQGTVWVNESKESTTWVNEVK